MSSTGQQKALLIGVVLSHAALLAGVRGFSPMLLLDEPLVHLDTQRRAALFEALRGLPAQAFLTGTDSEVFAPLRDDAEMVRTGSDLLQPDPA
jgi:DNA replication and repair protein RecF